MPTATMIRHAIAEGLHHDAVLDADNIDVVCDGPDVWLGGTVDSWAAWRRADLAARSTPGVRFVHNDIHILVPRLSLR
jgi:osmotically-inducible protein OsmY